MGREAEKANWNKRNLLLKYRQLVDFIRVDAQNADKENNKFEQKLKSLAIAKLRCKHVLIMPADVNAEIEAIRKYTYSMRRLASDYISYSRFNNYYGNMFYLRKFNESCEKLADYLEIDISPESEDKVTEEDFLKKIKDPLTDEHLRKYIEVYYLGEKERSFYGNLMRENSCGDKLNPEQYRLMRESVFIPEIERMLQKEDSEFEKASRSYGAKYVTNRLLKPWYFITGNKNRFKSRDYAYSVLKENIISDLRAYAKTYGVEYLVKKYNEMRANLDETGDYWRSCSDEDKKIYGLMNYIRMYSHNHVGILSFFIESNMFDDKTDFRADSIADMRYYINIDGDNIYKFTEEYVKLAKKQGLPFCIKVVDAERNEDERTERLVIYSSFESMQKNLDILRQIRMKHPEFGYGEPPITVATIDDWIGFGSEPKSKYSSYNADRAELLEKAIKQIFGARGSEEDGKAIMEKIKMHPELLDDFRKKITELSESCGVSKEHFFLDKQDEEYFEARGSRYIFSDGSHVLDYHAVHRAEDVKKSKTKSKEKVERDIAR